jgi:hypothetical protein
LLPNTSCISPHFLLSNLLFNFFGEIGITPFFSGKYNKVSHINARVEIIE